MGLKVFQGKPLANKQFHKYGEQSHGSYFSGEMRVFSQTNENGFKRMQLSPTKKIGQCEC